MTRLKWLFIGFVAGAMFGAASAKYDVAGPVKSKISGMRGGCCADDESPRARIDARPAASDAAPAGETPAE